MKSSNKENTINKGENENSSSARKGHPLVASFGTNKSNDKQLKVQLMGKCEYMCAQNVR